MMMNSWIAVCEIGKFVSFELFLAVRFVKGSNDNAINVVLFAISCPSQYSQHHVLQQKST